MLFIDANVLMYAAGAPHPNKAASAALLEAIALGEVEAVTSAEVLQELLHRYRAIGRWSDGREVYDLTRRIIPAVLSVSVEMTDRGRELLDEHPELMARDALHATTCELLGADLCSYDADFDGVPGLQRREPEQVLGRA